MKKISLIILISYIIILFVLLYKTNYSIRSRLLSIENNNTVAPEGDNPEQQKSLFSRLFGPMISKVLNGISSILPISPEAEAQLQNKLQKAGSSYTARQYTSLQATVYIFVTVIAVLYSMLAKLDLMKTVLAVVLGIYGTFAFFRFSLSSKITKRKDQIEEEMPDILDLLSVSVVAGLGFDQALKYVVDRCQGILVDEFAVAQNEIALGRPRSVALKKVAERCEVDSLNSFVGAIVQAEVLGIPISKILQTQSENIRQMQRDKKEEKAAKLPVKILIPLVFLIFPTMFVVILGPAVPRLVEALGGM